MSKWQSVKGKTNTKGRWEVCQICEGHGADIQYLRKPECKWCEGKGKVWREVSDKTYKPSQVSADER